MATRIDCTPVQIPACIQVKKNRLKRVVMTIVLFNNAEQPHG